MASTIFTDIEEGTTVVSDGCLIFSYYAECMPFNAVSDCNLTQDHMQMKYVLAFACMQITGRVCYLTAIQLISIKYKYTILYHFSECI